MRVLKWPVRVNDLDHAIGGGTVVHVACQEIYRPEVQVWTLEDDAPVADRTVRVFGTGQDIPLGWKPVGSALADVYVWHVFEAPRPS